MQTGKMKTTKETRKDRQLRRCLLLAFMVFLCMPMTAQDVNGVRKNGKWVDPVKFFELSGHGELDMDQLADAMWKKGRYMQGMKLVTYKFTRNEFNPVPDKLLFATPATFYLYNDTPITIWTNQIDAAYRGCYSGVWFLRAKDMGFNFNHNTHHYEFSYTPLGQFEADTWEGGTVKMVNTSETEMRLGYRPECGVWGSFLTVLPDNVVHKEDNRTYVYFKVEEVLLDGEETPLTEEQRVELGGVLDDLLDALRHYVGVTGQHAGPIPSAIISAISAISAILFANGVASIGGDVGGFFGGGSPSPTPEPAPDYPYGGTPPQPNGRRDEENQPPPPEPQSPEQQYWKKYVTEDAEGTLTMRDPATGKVTHYYPQENGEYMSDSGFTYGREDIAENQRLRAENAGYFGDIANKAARDVAEQREQNARIDAETQARGDAIRAQREAEAQEEAKRKDYLDKLSQKYGVDASDENALYKAISDEQSEAEREGRLWQKTADILDTTTKTLEVIDKASEITVNIMGDCVPGGAAVKNVYTFAHSVASYGGKAYADGKSGWDFAAEIGKGAVDGGLGVLQNCAGDLASNAYTEGIMVVGSEGIRKGIEAMSDPENSADDVLTAMRHGMTSKLNNFLIGKGVQKGIDTMGKAADQTIGLEQVNLQNDTGIRFDSSLDAMKYKSFMRGSYETGIGSVVKQKAIVSAAGELGGLTGNYGMDSVGNFITDDAIPAAAAIPDDVAYYVNTVKEFSDKAAQFRQQRGAI
jgi:hypothetical protein